MMAIIQKILLFVLIFASSLLIWKLATLNPPTRAQSETNCFGENTIFPQLRAAVVKTLLKNKEGKPFLANLHKLDFSLPGTPTYGDDPQFEIFNPEGGNFVVPDLSAASKNPIFQFTLGNRTKNIGTNQTELIVVMGEIFPEVCQKIEEANSNTTVPIIYKLNLIPFPQEPETAEIVELPSIRGCVQVNGDFYFYQTLIDR